MSDEAEINDSRAAFGTFSGLTRRDLLTEVKRCPQCNHIEADHALRFCRSDGTPLVWNGRSVNESAADSQYLEEDEKDTVALLPGAPAGPASISAEAQSQPSARMAV
ncbi:MAG TPA: hypothetical protein VEZ90_12955, partial [Blastocatellia bacterium]|nr:hypothetical protein [Blastocatellia bacterium]